MLIAASLNRKLVGAFMSTNVVRPHYTVKKKTEMSLHLSWYLHQSQTHSFEHPVLSPGLSGRSRTSDLVVRDRVAPTAGTPLAEFAA
jgi:hypothetical protein